LQKKPDAFMRSNFEWEQTEREASEVEAWTSRIQRLPRTLKA
jgi:hypothetical protein